MRRLLVLLCASITLVGSLAYAQPWPTRPVRIVVGFSAGSAAEISARMIGPKLEEIWGQPVVIENRPGAGSTIANTSVAKASPMATRSS